MDMAKPQYDISLQEAPGLLLSLGAAVSVGMSIQSIQEGWALKELKKADRLTQGQKDYLEQSSISNEVVAKEMHCRAREKDGNKLFCCERVPHSAAKLRQKQSDVVLQDILTAEEPINFSRARANVLSSRHPGP